MIAHIVKVQDHPGFQKRWKGMAKNSFENFRFCFSLQAKGSLLACESLSLLQAAAQKLWHSIDAGKARVLLYIRFSSFEVFGPTWLRDRKNATGTFRVDPH